MLIGSKSSNEGRAYKEKANDSEQDYSNTKAFD